MHKYLSETDSTLLKLISTNFDQMQAPTNLLQISTVTNEAATLQEQLSDGSAKTLNEKQGFAPYKKDFSPQLNSFAQCLGGMGSNINAAANPLEQNLAYLQSVQISKPLQPEYQRAANDIGIINSSAAFA